MAGSLSDVFEVDLLKIITSQTTTIITTTPFANVYIALIVSGATDAAAGTECTGTSYARVDSNGLWAVPAAGSVATNAAVTFPAAGHATNWGTLTQFAIYDAITAGNRLAWGDLAVSKTPGLGDVISFASGAIVITLT